MDGVRLAVLSNRFKAVVAGDDEHAPRAPAARASSTARATSPAASSPPTTSCSRWRESLPIHVHERARPDGAARSCELHPDLRRGDAFLHNSPYHGNSHAADHSILVPVIDDDGVHRFTVLAKAHQADCGNSLPTTYIAAAARRLRGGRADLPDASRSSSDYADIEDVIRMCRLRIRVPEQWWGDYLALLGAARIGERRLLELGAEVGWDALDAVLAASGSTTASSGWSRGRREAARGRDRSPTAATTRSPASRTGSRSRSAIDVDPSDGGSSRSTCATTSTASRAAST